MSGGETGIAILSRFRGVRHNGTGWVALCPAHADKIPSLSITVSNGKILLHCHAGCSVETVCSAAGIELRELFTDGNTIAAEAVAEYSYSDESGRMLYQVVRFEPKSFRQRRPDGRGGWVWQSNRDASRSLSSPGGAKGKISSRARR